MAKYILKSVDDTADDMAATVTYEFESDLADNVTWHLAQFMRAAGFTWVESLEIVKEGYNDSEFDELDDSELVEDDSMLVNKDSTEDKYVSVTPTKDSK
jgi:hypothetical protein